MTMFVLDRNGAAEVLKFTTAEEVSALAAQVAAAAGPEAIIETKASKTRFVATVKVPDALQATDGVLSRAATGLGLTINPYAKPDAPAAKKQLGFRSRVQWRWAFWSRQPWARPKAQETPGAKLIRYRQLPERAGNKATPDTGPRTRGRPRKNPT